MADYQVVALVKAAVAGLLFGAAMFVFLDAPVGLAALSAVVFGAAMILPALLGERKKRGIVTPPRPGVSHANPPLSDAERERRQTSRPLLRSSSMSSFTSLPAMSPLEALREAVRDQELHVAAARRAERKRHNADEKRRTSR
jgi:hypothetical protein